MTHPIKHRLTTLWLKATDPRRLSELAGERVVFNHLQVQGFLGGLGGKRILEVGPKHGLDSMLLATLNPAHLVLIDLPEKRAMVGEWFYRVPCRTSYREGNLLYLSPEQYDELGKFDLIWCLGVLYHNTEQLRLLHRLFDLCSVGGRVVVESATTRRWWLHCLNVVEVCWPRPHRDIQTITHLPSRRAIKSWMEMAGFVDVRIEDIYSRRLARWRAVLTGRKTEDSRPYVGYAESGLNPPYVAGDAR